MQLFLSLGLVVTFISLSYFIGRYLYYSEKLINYLSLNHVGLWCELGVCKTEWSVFDLNTRKLRDLIRLKSVNIDTFNNDGFAYSLFELVRDEYENSIIFFSVAILLVILKTFY